MADSFCPLKVTSNLFGLRRHSALIDYRMRGGALDVQSQRPRKQVIGNARKQKRRHACDSQSMRNRRRSPNFLLHHRKVELFLMQIRIGLDRHRVPEVRLNLFHYLAFSRAQSLGHVRRNS